MLKKSNPILIIFIKIAIQVAAGPFTFASHPFPITIAALIVICALFFISLYQEDYFSFLIQLFICNHFNFGYENGGVFNLAAIAALLLYLLTCQNKLSLATTLGKLSIVGIIALAIIQMLCLINNDTALNLRIVAALSFFNLLILFYTSSKIELSVQNYFNFLQIVGIYFLYMFAVSLNQKYIYFHSPFEFFPNLNPNADYEMGITRSTGTLGNYEAYAEYCVSIIALFLPGIVTGSLYKINKVYYYLFCGVVLTAVLGIVLSGTRSSILLLPFMIIAMLFLLGKRVKIKAVFAGIALIAVFIGVNGNGKFIDYSVFLQRSETVDFKTVTLSSIITGRDMNRGDIFAYAFKKIDKTSGLIGEGYFTNRKEYTKVHFDQGDDTSIPDYHNLYLSSIVIWGYAGTTILLYLFLVTIMRGIRLYLKMKSDNFFLVDMLLGFNLLFVFFLVNQFKIQFIRDANYFMMILLLLAIYNALIQILSTKVIVTQEAF